MDNKPTWNLEPISPSPNDKAFVLLRELNEWFIINAFATLTFHDRQETNNGSYDISKLHSENFKNEVK